MPKNIRKGIHWEDRFEHPYWHHLTKKEVKQMCADAGLTVRRLHCGGFTIFITTWLPPIITSLLDKAWGNYLGKAIFVEASR